MDQLKAVKNAVTDQMGGIGGIPSVGMSVGMNMPKALTDQMGKLGQGSTVVTGEAHFLEVQLNRQSTLKVLFVCVSTISSLFVSSP